MKSSSGRSRSQLRNILGGPLARIHRFLAEEVWTANLEELPWPKHLVYKLARITWLAGHGFVTDQCSSRAAALTYITILGLVPLLAFAFSAAKGLGAYDTLRRDVIESYLDEQLGPVEGAEGSEQPAQKVGEAGAGLEVAEDPQPPGAEQPVGEAVPVPAGGDAQDPPPGADPEPSAEPKQMPESIRKLRTYIEQILGLVEKTDFKTLGGLGLAFLIYAVIKMISSVEFAFNSIWGVKRSRSIARKISDYISMTVVTPVLMVIAVFLTTAAKGNDLYARLHDVTIIGDSLDFLLRLGPLVAVWIGFTFLLYLLPNTRTSFVSSLLGGLVGGLLWQVAQIAHIEFQVGLARADAIFAGFAAFPIFLIWLNVSWVTVMVGAEVAYAHQNEHAHVALTRTRNADHAFYERLALRLIARVGAGFLAGEPPRSHKLLATELEVPTRNVAQVVDLLIEAGVLAEAGEDGLLPARDLGSMTVKTVLDALGGQRGVLDPGGDNPTDARISELMGELDDEFERSPLNRSLEELARSGVADQSPPVASAETPGESPPEA